MTTARAPRPYGVEVDSFDDDTAAKLVHGTPMLAGGQYQADWRDATFLSRPDVRTIKARHIVVASHRYAIGSGSVALAAACDPMRIALLDGPADATEVHPNGRCRRPGCRQLFAEAERAAKSIEHIASYYGLHLGLGMQVTARSRSTAGRIVGFDGDYVRVLLDGRTRPDVYHTGDFTYPAAAYTGRVGAGTGEIAKAA